MTYQVVVVLGESIIEGIAVMVSREYVDLIIFKIFLKEKSGLSSNMLVVVVFSEKQTFLGEFGQIDMLWQE